MEINSFRDDCTEFLLSVSLYLEFYDSLCKCQIVWFFAKSLNLKGVFAKNERGM